MTDDPNAEARIFIRSLGAFLRNIDPADLTPDDRVKLAALGRDMRAFAAEIRCEMDSPAVLLASLSTPQTDRSQ